MKNSERVNKAAKDALKEMAADENLSNRLEKRDLGAVGNLIAERSCYINIDDIILTDGITMELVGDKYIVRHKSQKKETQEIC